MPEDYRFKIEKTHDLLPRVEVGNVPVKQIDVELDEPFQHLTEASTPHLKKRLAEFSSQVLREARSIEKAEHVGSGPPEITAAHIDEAWWVIRRRVRRSRYPILGVAARVIQAFAIAGFGIGATILKTDWGPTVFVVSALAVIGGFLTEAHLARKE